MILLYRTLYESVLKFVFIVQVVVQVFGGWLLDFY